MKKKPNIPPAPQVQMLPIASISDHPSLKYLPTLEEASYMAVADEAEDTPDGDWSRLVVSIRETGLIEPIKVIANPNGGWWCVDGRSRLAAVLVLNTSPEWHGMTEIAAIVVEDIDVEAIARETMSRRNVPSFVGAYLYCRQHQDVLCAAKRGGDRSKVPTGTLPTQDQAAEACAVRKETIVACIAALKHFREHPADCERDEPRILAGLMHPSRFVHAAAGRAATVGKERRPTSFVSWAPKWKSMVSNLRGWDQWAESDRENAKALLAKEAAEWPEGFKAIVTEILNPQ